MKNFLLLLVFFSSAITESQAQFTRYIVKLKNKGGTPYTFSSPINYLSQRAVNRRIRYGIAIDSADLPVTPSYITQISAVPNVTVLNVSRWLNAVTIQTNNAASLTTINSFPFVQVVNGIAARTSDNGRANSNKFEMEEIVTNLPSSFTESITADYFNYGTNSYNEIHLHNGEFLHNIGLRGQGMQIAMLDNGFNNYTSLRAFDSVNFYGQVLGTWDFVAREQNVANDGSHGMSCFSTIAANIPGQFIGKAPKASFWLYQTEDNSSEYPIEEFNWVCGAERADSSGSDVISSSLGYNTFDNTALNYSYSNMNGNTTISSTGADIAAKKGLMVFNAVGNSGGNSWRFLITPADGDSVVAVGAVSVAGTVGGFSSYGPSSDGQIKPDMASVGVSALIQTASNTVGTSNGTSYSCPKMAGLGTILWQAFPEFNNMRIIQALRRAGSKFNTPDDRVGYGIPNMKVAFTDLLSSFVTSSASLTGCNAVLNWTSKDVAAMKYEIERRIAGELIFTKVGEVTPMPGNILATHSYQFSSSITAIPAGTVSYRIKQIVDTVTASLTFIYIPLPDITIQFPCIGKDKVLLAPNPTSGNTKLIVETNNAVPNLSILIYNMNGSLVMKFSKSKGPGILFYDIPSERLNAGKYIIAVMDDKKIIGRANLLKL